MNIILKRYKYVVLLFPSLSTTQENKKSEGKYVKSVITSASFLLHQKAEETQSDLPDLADKYRTESESLLELYNRLPDFFVTK